MSPFCSCLIGSYWTCLRFGAESSRDVHLVLDGIVQEPLGILQVRPAEVCSSRQEVKCSDGVTEDGILLVQRRMRQVVAEYQSGRTATLGCSPT